MLPVTVCSVSPFDGGSDIFFFVHRQISALSRTSILFLFKSMPRLDLAMPFVVS
jgi:hypothetical protein